MDIDEQKIYEELSKVRDMLERGEAGKEQLEKIAPFLKDAILSEKGMLKVLAKQILDVGYENLRHIVKEYAWSKEPSLRNTAIELVAKHKDKQMLKQMLESENKDIRKLAMDTAYLMEDKDALRKGLEDPDINVMSSAAEYLSRLFDTESAPLIARKLEEVDDPYTIQFLANALVELRYKGVSELVRKKLPLTSQSEKMLYIKALGVDGNWSEIIKYLDEKNLTKVALDALLASIREAKLSEEDKKMIRKKIESKVPYLTLEELEIAEKITEVISG